MTVETFSPDRHARLRPRESHSVPADPIFLLSPPRSYSTVICAMLGQHPELYGLPETQLFAAETMSGWWLECAHANFPMSHGLLRAVAELCFRGQTAEDVARGAGWLRRRGTATTSLILEELALRVAPRRLVEKSPTIVYRAEWMNRARRMFPSARFIHLTRHPRGHCDSVIKHLRQLSSNGPAPGWLLNLAADPYGSPARVTIDPQANWLRLHRNISEFMGGLPADQALRVRGEDVLNEPHRVLPRIAEWLGIGTDAQAIDEMMHPERSPFAGFGPPGAEYGNDICFMESPTLRPPAGCFHSLDGPLEWRRDGHGFRPEVRELAHEFGYD